MRVRGLIEESLFRLRAGPRCAVTWVCDRLLDARVDHAMGIDTRSRIQSGNDSADFVHYQPVSYRDLNESLEMSAIRPDDVFVDIGAGLGRVVCVAALRRARSVIGIELSGELCAGAERNIARVRDKFACPDVRVVHANALEYVIPPDVSIVFLFNPLSGNALRSFLLGLGQSVREHPRPLRLLFTGTVSSERFRREAAVHSFLELAAERRLMTGARALLYNVRNQP